MAIATHWKIEHVCGHRAERDLSDRPADKRAGFARWLRERECIDCWKASREDGRSTVEWLQDKRAEEAAAAQTWQRRYEMPPLEGPVKAVPWGERCRHQLVTAAYTALVEEGETSEAEWAHIEQEARAVTRPGWWIDQRETDPADLPELLAAATESDRPTENPHL